MNLTPLNKNNKLTEFVDIYNTNNEVLKVEIEKINRRLDEIEERLNVRKSSITDLVETYLKNRINNIKKDIVKQVVEQLRKDAGV
ncbi:MAG: hypothetical protein J1E95_10910 [Muribaculaceae bacterium]|nr:hypothetical protein [Muribaculaceae bacterium]